MNKLPEYSPAVSFFGSQRHHRNHVRAQFKGAADEFLIAHEMSVSAITSCLKRFQGRKWPSGLDGETKEKAAQSAQLAVFFIQGIDPCEELIAEGLYGQAASLVRQHMEILGAIDEVWLGKRTAKRTPNISTLPHYLRQHYGGLSELAHASVPDYLDSLHTGFSKDLVGASTEPNFKEEIALFLYRIELGLLVLLAQKQDEILQKTYGEGLSSDELHFLTAAIQVADKMASTIDDQAQV